LTSAAGEKTDADQQWELNTLRKKAVAAESREEWDRAIALFEQIIQRGTHTGDVEWAREHVQEIRNRRAL
jgi:hypothetical protein